MNDDWDADTRIRQQFEPTKKTVGQRLRLCDVAGATPEDEPIGLLPGEVDHTIGVGDFLTVNNPTFLGRRVVWLRPNNRWPQGW